VYLIHWNAVEWCASAAESVLGSRGVAVELTVVDNGASGGPALRAALPPGVGVLTLPENRGYTGGANAALADWAARRPDAPFAVIASHDLHTDPDALARLVAVMDDESIGITGPAVLGPTISYGGAWDGSRGRLIKAPPASDDAVDRDWVSGTCVLLRRDCCDAVGAFDATLGSYVEDVDYALRARDRGWRVVIVPAARTWGLGTSDPRAVRLATRNTMLLAAKRNGGLGYGRALVRTATEVARGHAVTVRPGRSHAQRLASRRLANDRLAGMVRALEPRRVAGVLRARRSEQPREPGGAHVVFLSHEAHRSGAPVVLLTFVRWLTANSSTRCTVVFAEDGPMVDEFALTCAVHRLPAETSGVGRARRRLGLPAWTDAPRWIRARRLRRRIGRADLVYANTMTSAPALALLGYRTPVVCHVHELPGAIRRRVPARDIAAMVARTDRFVAVSDAVRHGLVEELGVAPDRVQVVHGFLEPDLLDAPRDDDARADARRALGLDPASFVAGGAGRADWAKGADRFVEVAARVRRGRGADDTRFAWIGPVKAGPRQELEAAATAERVADAVTFIGERSDAPGCFTAFDVLALTSREDSYPLVMLECAALGIPTVCFADGGGAPEFVGAAGGVVVPAGDLDAFARVVTRLAADPEERRRRGQRARDLVVSKHTVDELAPQILEAMERVR
jgi:glycosyltransferase involved in cell wall biosynthesis/GT2 family glycosyltransferase